MRIERFKILGRDYGIPEEDESQMRIESLETQQQIKPYWQRNL